MRKILVSSPHSLLRAGFRALFTDPERLEICECPAIADLPDSLAQNFPDLVLLDLASLTDVGVVRTLRRQDPHCGIILWADWISLEFVREVIQIGVRGILRKDATTAEYSQCLDHVAEGQLWLERDLREKLLSAKSIRLSPRERQLICLLTEGLRNKEIAGRMNITEGTAKAYLSRLFEKTGASDRFELAVFALRNLETDPATGPSRGPRLCSALQSLRQR